MATIVDQGAATATGLLCLCTFCTLMGCGSSHSPDGGPGADSAIPDAGDTGSAADSGAGSDAGRDCSAMDVRGEGACRALLGFYWDGSTCMSFGGCECVGADCGDVFGTEEACAAAFAHCEAGTCRTDGDCAAGAEWCVGGACVPCDDSGTVCDLACIDGWSMYERNGCSPCECAPVNDCTTDIDCALPEGAARKCYAGSQCWDWCRPGDPSCCLGNVCDNAGCDTPTPHGCLEVGCPGGATCRTGGDSCGSSSCFCDPSSGWSCTEDCGGGECAP